MNYNLPKAAQTVCTLLPKRTTRHTDRPAPPSVNDLPGAAQHTTTFINRLINNQPIP